MTRDEQIAGALALLAPAPEKCAECQHDIESKLDAVNRLVKMQTAVKASKTKKGKAALRRYRKALESLHSAHGALRELKPWFSLDLMTLVERELDNDLLKAKRRAVTPKRSAILPKIAVPLACALLIRWGHKPTVTRNGQWELMTKILANTDESVFEHIRTFKKLKPRFGKLLPHRVSV